MFSYNAPVLVKKYVVTIDEEYDRVKGRSLRKAAFLALNNQEIFPAVPGIALLDERRRWKRGDMVMVNWPRWKGDINLVETEVYDTCKRHHTVA